IDPNYADAYFNLAAIRERQGRKDEAIQYFRQTIRRQASNRKVRFQLGRLLLEAGREPEAEREFLAMIGPAPDQDSAIRAIAGAYRATGRNRAATRFARKAMSVAALRGLADAQ